MVDIAVAFVIGLTAGSFLNLCAYRLPRRESIVSPRSRCTSCWTFLGARDLVPVLSYLWLRGRCAHCGAPISKRDPLVEVGTGLMFALLRAPLEQMWLFAIAALAASAGMLGLLLAAERRVQLRGGVHRGL
jgi:leader peptidase (prepilin peptidase)/N-methyltransferase